MTTTSDPSSETATQLACIYRRASTGQCQRGQCLHHLETCPGDCELRKEEPVDIPVMVGSAGGVVLAARLQETYNVVLYEPGVDLIGGRALKGLASFYPTLATWIQAQDDPDGLRVSDSSQLDRGFAEAAQAYLKDERSKR